MSNSVGRKSGINDLLLGLCDQAAGSSGCAMTILMALVS